MGISRSPAVSVVVRKALPSWLVSAAVHEWRQAPGTSINTIIRSESAVLGASGARTLVAGSLSKGWLGDDVRLTSNGIPWNARNPHWNGQAEPAHSRQQGASPHLFGDSGAAFRPDTAEFIWGATGGGAGCWNSDVVIVLKASDDAPVPRVFRNRGNQPFSAVSVEDIYASDEPGRVAKFYNRNDTPAASHTYRSTRWVPSLGSSGALLRVTSEKVWNTDNGWLGCVHRWDYGDLKWKAKETEAPVKSYDSGTSHGVLDLRSTHWYCQQCQDSEGDSILVLGYPLYPGGSLWKRNHQTKSIAPVPYTNFAVDINGKTVGRWYSWPDMNMEFAKGGIFETWTVGKTEEYLLIRALSGSRFRWFVVDLKPHIGFHTNSFHPSPQGPGSVQVSSGWWTPVKNVVWEVTSITGPGVEYLATSENSNNVAQSYGIGCVWDADGGRFILYQNDGRLVTLTPTITRSGALKTGASLRVDVITPTGTPPDTKRNGTIYNRMAYSSLLKSLLLMPHEDQNLFAVRLR